MHEPSREVYSTMDGQSPGFYLILLGLAVMSAGPVRAQTFHGLAPNASGPLFRADVAGNRAEASFDRQPIHLGSLELQSSVGLTAGFDSNVYNRHNGEADAVFDLQPNVSLHGNWFPLDLSLSASGDVRRYTKDVSENRETFGTNLSARYEIGYATVLGMAADYSNFAEDRGSDGLGAALAEPVQGQMESGRIFASTGLGSLYLRLDAGLSRRDYRPVKLTSGSVMDLAYRDSEALTLGGQLGAPLGKNNVVFVALDYGKNRSPNAPASIRRDSQSIQAVVGVRGDLSDLVSAEVSTGYTRQDFEIAGFADYSGLTFTGAIDWYARPLLSVRLSAAQTMRNSGLQSVPAILERSAGLSAYYDPLPKLRTHASLNYSNSQYRGIGVTTQRLVSLLTTSFRISERLYTEASAGWRWQWGGNVLAQSYTGLTAKFGLRVAL